MGEVLTQGDRMIRQRQGTPIVKRYNYARTIQLYRNADPINNSSFFTIKVKVYMKPNQLIFPRSVKGSLQQVISHKYL